MRSRLMKRFQRSPLPTAVVTFGSGIRSQLVLPLIALVSVSALGCGGSSIKEPDLAQVKGKITINGEPAVGVDVMFHPVSPDATKQSEVGGISSARTNEQGEYSLLYKQTTGAVVGKHTVEVRRDDGNVDAPPGPPIPPKYNSESELSAEVKAGEENVINFDLKVPK